MEIPRTIKISNGKKFSYFLLMFGDYPIYRVDNGRTFKDISPRYWEVEAIVNDKTSDTPKDVYDDY